MGLEIERKFLCSLSYIEAMKLSCNSREIESIYIKNTKTESLRVVRDRYRNGDVICKWTEKFSQDGLLARIENEENLPEEIFKIVESYNYPSVFKERFIIEVNGNMWEVDFFKDYDFVIAELEFNSIEEANDFTEFPSWIIEEVTNDPSYLNCNLAG